MVNIKLLLFAFLVATLSSCVKLPSVNTSNLSPSERRATKKVARLLAKYPNIIKSDSSSKLETKITIIEKEINHQDSIREKQAHKMIDSLLAELTVKCPDLISETTPKTSIIHKVGNSIKRSITIESLMSPIVIDTAGAKVYITAQGNNLKVKVQLPVVETKETKTIEVVIPCVEPTYWNSLWRVKEVIGALIFLVLMLFGLILLMK
jgi:hypothetical protein